MAQTKKLDQERWSEFKHVQQRQPGSSINCLYSVTQSQL